MAKKKEITFLTEVLEQREDIVERAEGGVSRKLHAELRRTRVKMLDEIDKLKPFTRPDGSLVDVEGTRRAKKRIVDNIDDILDSSRNKNVITLSEAQSATFNKGVLDVKMAVDVGTKGAAVLEPSFREIFTDAANVASKMEVLGIKTDKAFNGVTQYTKNKVRSTITEHIIRGRTVGDTAKEIKQIMNINERAATRIARTNINAATTAAHRMVYDSNPDTFVGYRWDAVFDSRTSLICAKLHGTVYKLKSNAPGPPAHPNCRSDLVGIFKDAELQAAVDDSPRFVRSTRTDKKKKIPARTKFSEWLHGEDSDVQRRILGSDIKVSLWRQRKISFDDVIGDDLVARSDKSVVQRALAKHPKDDAVKRLARKLDVKPKAKTKIIESDLRKAREVPWSVGIKPGTAKRIQEKRERIDALKEKRIRDQFNRLAERAAKKSAQVG